MRERERERGGREGGREGGGEGEREGGRERERERERGGRLVAAVSGPRYRVRRGHTTGLSSLRAKIPTSG